MATQFTTGTSPQTGSGQVWVENSNGEWEIANVTAPGVVLQTFTANGTYTPSPGMIFCIVEAVGAGGGGGGVTGGATSESNIGGGGGGGGYSRSLLTSADIGSSQTVTIGSGGSGGAAGNNNGSAGGNTSLGSLVIANGGSGGAYTDLGVSFGSGGAGGTAGTGDFTPTGFPGENGSSGGAAEFYGGGNGGSSVFGGGARIVYRDTGGTGTGYGSGGAGGWNFNEVANEAGGAGADGCIIITEYIRQSVLSPIAYDSNGNEILDLVNGEVASAVNHVQVDNAATGTGPGISAIGDDTNIDLNLTPKGTGVVLLDGYEAGTYLLNSGTVASASSDLDIALDTYGSTFDGFTLELYEIRSDSDGASFVMRTSQDGGSTFSTASDAYSYNIAYATTGDTAHTYANSGGVATYLLLAPSVGSVANDTLNGKIYISNPDDTSLAATFGWEFWGRDSGSKAMHVEGAGRRNGTSDITDVKLLFSTSTIDGFQWRLLGHRL